MSDGPSPIHEPSKLRYAQSFDDLRREGFVVFALGPVYAYAGVQESLPDRFAVEGVPGRPDRVYGMEIHFERPVLARCQDWNLILNTMDKDSYAYFHSWMLSLQFVDRVKRKFFVVRHYTVPIRDPIAWQAVGQLRPASLEVYTLSGFKGILRPIQPLEGIAAITDADPDTVKPEDHVRKRTAASMPAFVDFDITPPEEDVIVLGRKALNIIDEG